MDSLFFSCRCAPLVEKGKTFAPFKIVRRIHCCYCVFAPHRYRHPKTDTQKQKKTRNFLREDLKLTADGEKMAIHLIVITALPQKKKGEEDER